MIELIYSEDPQKDQMNSDVNGAVFLDHCPWEGHVYLFIGYLAPHGGSRYMIPTSGSGIGVPVRANGTWASMEDTEFNFRAHEGRFFAFDTANELYDWLKE